MGWNGSNNSIEKSPNQPVNRTIKPLNNQTIRPGIVVGVLVTVICGTAVWWFAGRGGARPSPVQDAKHDFRIAEVKPQIATNEVAEEVVELTPEEKEMAERQAKRAAVIRRRQEKLRKAMENMRPADPYAIFNHPSENRIAGLLTLEPGTPVLLPPRFTDRFEADFRESCKEPIIVREDDPEDVKRLKYDMIACKIELSNRMAAGEKLGDILSEAHNELRKLGEIKTEIEQMTRREIRANAMSENDVASYIEAANKMLEAKGITPMRDNPVLRRSLQRAALRNAGNETTK